MYARRRRRKLSPERIDAWAESYAAEVPRLLQLPGFVGAYVLADRATGDGESFSFWESAETLASSRSGTDALGSQQRVAIGLETTSIESLEVISRTGDVMRSDATYAVVLEETRDPARLDAVRAAYDERYLRVLRDEAGFLGALLLVDRGSGRSVVLALHGPRADLRSTAERQDALQSELATEAPPGAPAPELHRYEIIARTTASG